jgi:branched-chain amino acid aminotransferase
MSGTSYVCLNGTFRNAYEPVLHSQNRGFRYADMLAEDIHAYATEPQFLAMHLEMLQDGMKLMGMVIPESFETAFFRHLITRLLNKNRIFGGAHIRLTVFREGEELASESDKVSFLLESLPLTSGYYFLNERGWMIDVCTEYVKPACAFSSLASASSRLYVMTSMLARKRGMDALILLNNEGRLVESPGCHVFLVSGSSVYTPGFKQGCSVSVMRQLMLDLAGQSGLNVNDESKLTPGALEDADEVFFVNALAGIRWAGGYKQRRYYKKTALQLLKQLNDLAFSGMT